MIKLDIVNAVLAKLDGAGVSRVKAEQAVETNWRHAADRLSRVIELAGERGAW